MVFNRRFHEVAEERMSPVDPAFQLRMELTSHEPRMVRQFNDLNEVQFRIDTAETETVLLKCLAVTVIYLVPVSVALRYSLFPVSLYVFVLGCRSQL